MTAFCVFVVALSATTVPDMPDTSRVSAVMLLLPSSDYVRVSGNGVVVVGFGAVQFTVSPPGTWPIKDVLNRIGGLSLRRQGSMCDNVVISFEGTGSAAGSSWYANDNKAVEEIFRIARQRVKDANDAAATQPSRLQHRELLNSTSDRKSATNPATHPGTHPGTQVLLRHALAEGREVVVLKNPLVSVSAIKDMLSRAMVEGSPNPPIGFFSIAVEIRLASGPPLRVWSQTHAVYQNSDYNEYQVLDLIALPDRIVMARALAGSGIMVDSVTLYGRSSSYSLPGSQWSLLAARIPATRGRLGAKLAYNEEKKRIEVEVTDHLQGIKQHSLFEQNGDEWTFMRIKQWQEKVPTTSPTLQP